MIKEYISRNIDKELIAWKDDPMRKPLYALSQLEKIL